MKRYIKHINFCTITLLVTLAVFTISGISFAAGRKTIKDARGINGADGKRIPDIEQNVTVSGIATLNDGIVLTHKVFDYSSFYFMETYADGTTAGLNAYQGPEKGPAIGTWDKDNSPRYVQEGDSLTITGKIMQFNGNMEVSADPNFNIVIHSTGNALPTPIVITCKQAGAKSTGNDGGELYEGKLIRIEKAKIKSVYKTGGGPSYTINDGTGDLTMFVYNMTDIIRQNLTLPSGETPLRITGIHDQYGKTGGDGLLKYYQILPRRFDDIVPQPSKTGSIESPSRIFRTEADVATISIYDANVPDDTDLKLSTVTITVNSESDSTGFVIIATETKKDSPGSYSFQLGISKTATDTTVCPPKIKIADDGIITITYYDQSNDNGQLYTATYRCFFKPQLNNTLLLIPKRVFSVDRGERCEIKFNAPFYTVKDAKNNYRVTVKVFDIIGREIKRLVDNQYVDSGTVYWDGTDEHGTVVPIGTYIVHVLTRDIYGVKLDEQMKTIAVATKLN